MIPIVMPIKYAPVDTSHTGAPALIVPSFKIRAMKPTIPVMPTATAEMIKDKTTTKNTTYITPIGINTGIENKNNTSNHTLDVISLLVSNLRFDNEIGRAHV